MSRDLAAVLVVALVVAAAAVGGALTAWVAAKQRVACRCPVPAVTVEARSGDLAGVRRIIIYPNSTVKIYAVDKVYTATPSNGTVEYTVYHSVEYECIVNRYNVDGRLVVVVRPVILLEGGRYVPLMCHEAGRRVTVVPVPRALRVSFNASGG